MISELDEKVLDTLSLTKEFELALKIEKEYTKQLFVVHLMNVAKLGICAFIAFQFNHWWIILIGLLFQQSVRRVQTKTLYKEETENEKE